MILVERENEESELKSNRLNKLLNLIQSSQLNTDTSDITSDISYHFLTPLIFLF